MYSSLSCFASSSEADPIGVSTLLRDAGWLALCLYVLFLDRQPLGLDTLLAGRGRQGPPGVPG